jgi:hypothetical protein
MTLLTKIRQFLYNLATKSTVKKESEICKHYDALAWEKYEKYYSEGKKSSFNYKVLQKSLKTNQKRRDYKISQKTAKWNWLKP